ncbi:MAG: MFS transporter [Candidatus Omnitrophota bacterium]
MSFSLRIRFSAMMFLQYLIWAAWFINLGPYLDHRGFSSDLVSAFFLASLISPFIGGQIADRYMPTQLFMGISQIVGGIILIFLAKISNGTAFWWILFLYSMIYAPTLALSNSICFHHMTDKAKDFGAIRVWGTLGWIVAGLAMTFLWTYIRPYPIAWAEISALDAAAQQAQRAAYLNVESWLFILPGIVSIVFGLFCFSLPHTPPSEEKSNPWAFLEAFKMLKDKNFAMFIVIAFVVSTQLMFFFITMPVFLEYLNMNRQNIPTAMVTAQITEIVSMYLLMRLLVPKIGIRFSMAAAALAWGLLYGAAGLGQSWQLVVPALLLHGFAYVFFFVVGQVYVDAVASPQIRASAQGFINVVTIGLGMYLSSYFVSWVTEQFTTAAPGSAAVINYQGVFLVPCLLMILCALAFLLFFKEPEKKEAEAA